MLCSSKWMDHITIGLTAVLFLLTVSWCEKIPEKICSPGSGLKGYTVPHGDINVLRGKPLEIYCSCPIDKASDDITFTNPTKGDLSKWVTKVNSTTAKLLLPNMTLNDTGFYCCRNKTTSDLLCLNMVNVGEPPNPVLDFSCINPNWHGLICNWTNPNNGQITTNYVLNFTTDKPTNNQSNCKLNQTDDTAPYQCVLNLRSNSIYRMNIEYYYFFLKASNIYGTRWLNTTVNNFARMRPDKPGLLNCSKVTTDSIFISWPMPTDLQYFPSGLQYQIFYCPRSKTFKLHGTINSNSLNFSDLTTIEYNITNLDYPYEWYDIRVRVRSVKAVDDEMWSDNSTDVFRTAMKVPKRPPDVTRGCFKIESFKGQTRNIVIYWSKILDEERNGAEFKYYILNANDNIEFTTENTYMSFSHLSLNESYTFQIWSKNTMGLSEKYSVVHVPKQDDMEPEPSKFDVLKENDYYHFSWNKPSEDIANFTIFWCLDVEYGSDDVKCHGNLSWVVLPSNILEYDRKINDSQGVQFAISANTALSSSGMYWSSCTTIANSQVDKIRIFQQNGTGSTYVSLIWSLNCITNRNIIKEYIIFYCDVIVNDKNDDKHKKCRSLEQKRTTKYSSIKIDNLLPYTTYTFSVSAITKNLTMSPRSDEISVATLEGTPSPPELVHVTNVTNSSISIAWSPPTLPNGILSYYRILYNSQSAKVYIENNNSNVKKLLKRSYEINELQSYTNYTIKIEACGGNGTRCSRPSDPITQLTKMGYPGTVSHPSAINHNKSAILVRWDSPKVKGGRIDFYQVKITYHDNSEEIRNVTEPSLELATTCGENNFFDLVVRAVNLREDGGNFTGEWSDKYHNDCTSAFSVFFYILVPSILLIAIGMICLFKKLYFHCQIMRDVEVKLPAGLAPGLVPDMELAPWNSEMPSEDINRRTAADEELLLVKLPDNLHRSADSSGCSSGHDSGTPSIESGSSISSNTSDSGTEQPRSAADGEVHNNLLRQRNIGANRPQSNKNYIVMPVDVTLRNNVKSPSSSYTVLGDNPKGIEQGINTNRFSDNSSFSSKDYSSSTSGESSKYEPQYDFTSSSDETRPLPTYVVAGNKDMVNKNLDIGDILTVHPIQDNKMYVKVSNVQPLKVPDKWQKLVLDPSSTAGYVTIGEAPVQPTAIVKDSKPNIPHRQFDTKALKED